MPILGVIQCMRVCQHKSTDETAVGRRRTIVKMQQRKRNHSITYDIIISKVGTKFFKLPLHKHLWMKLNKKEMPLMKLDINI